MNSPQSEQWVDAINKEMDSRKEHEVYHLVPITNVPKRQEIIGSRFVQEKGGRPIQLAAQGYVHELGIDYDKLRARVRRIGSIQVLPATANEHGWPVYGLDVPMAFLQSKTTFDVYVKVAPGKKRRISRQAYS